MDQFYVYEHRRLDTGAVFYVGKGKGWRLRSKQQKTAYWRNVVKKAGGYEAVRVVDRLDEELALLAEVELIEKYRRLGVRLVNLTDGGEGMSGYVRSRESIESGAAKLRGRKRPDVSALLKGVPKSEDHKRKLAEARIGKKASDEARARMSEGRKGRPSSMLGKRHSESAKKKIADALRGEANPFWGKTHAPEVVQRIRDANLGRTDSVETRAKKSAARQGALNPLYGKPVSEERKARQIASLKARPLLVCPHCQKSSNEGNARRWHFDNCRVKEK